MDFEIISTHLLKVYLQNLPQGLQEAFDGLHDAVLSTKNFSYYTALGSVFSSKIEGEDIDLDSYIKHKRDRISFHLDYTKKIDDLYSAYKFAQINSLNEDNVNLAHGMLGRHIVTTPWQGKYRKQNMYVATDDGKIEYVAASPLAVEGEMEKLFADIRRLLETELSIEEVFYFGAMIHLILVKIHPWNDGNGRSARLIEKWFLAQKLGEKAWFLASEKLYYQHHQIYYQNMRALGLEYEQLDFENALPFLLMFPKSLFS